MSKIKISQLTELSDIHSANITGGYYYETYISSSKVVKRVNFSPFQVVETFNSQTAISSGGSAKNNGQNGGQNIIGNISINL